MNDLRVSVAAALLLADGKAIPTNRLAPFLGVSQAVVRDALARLRSEGFAIERRRAERPNQNAFGYALAALPPDEFLVVVLAEARRLRRSPALRTARIACSGVHAAGGARRWYCPIAAVTLAVPDPMSVRQRLLAAWRAQRAAGYGNPRPRKKVSAYLRDEPPQRQFRRPGNVAAATRRERRLAGMSRTPFRADDWITSFEREAS